MALRGYGCLCRLIFSNKVHVHVIIHIEGNHVKTSQFRYCYLSILQFVTIAVYMSDGLHHLGCSRCVFFLVHNFNYTDPDT